MRPTSRSRLRPTAVAALTLFWAHSCAAQGTPPVGDEEENPFKDSADSTNECYTWAADGQCIANPGYMTSSCKYSCWEWFEFRRKKYPDAPM